MKSKIIKLLTNPIVKIIFICLFWIFLVLNLRMLGASKIHQSGNPNYNPAFNTSFIIQPGVKWDSRYYLQIAEKGYGETKNSLPVFYPLFPMSVRIIAHVLHISYLSAGLLLNIMATIAAAVFMYLLAKDFFKDNSFAIQCVLLFLLFPFAYYLLAFYTEALFCALSFGSFYFARKRQWIVSCILLAFVGVTRATGLVVMASVFIEYLDSISWSPKKVTGGILAFLIAPLGFIAYLYYLWWHFGDPLMFKNAYKYGWTYQTFQPNILNTVYSNVASLAHQAAHPPTGWKDDWAQNLYTTLYEVGSWFVLIAAGIIGYLRNIPKSYIVYIGLTAIFVSLNSNLISVNRYILPVFPLYLILVDVLKRRHSLLALVLGSSAMIMGVMLTLFSNGFWTG